jgi:hypothetical protein
MVLLDEVNEAYVSGLVQNCLRFVRNDDYEGYCQGAMGMLIEFVEVYRAVVKILPNNHQDLKNGS